MTPPTELRDALDLTVSAMVARPLTLAAALEGFRLAYLRRVLIDQRGNQTRAAKVVGMHRNSLIRHIAKSPELVRLVRQFKPRRQTAKDFYRPDERPVPSTEYRVPSAGERRRA